MKSTLTVGARVMFSDAVVARSGHSKPVADMRGDLLMIDGAVAKVDTHGTFSAESGSPIRFIPLANLVRAR